MLVDDVTIGTRQVEVVGIVGFEACGNIAPCLDEVVVDDSTQGECFAQELCHVGVVLDVTILAEPLNGEVGTLNALVEFCVGIVCGVHLCVVCKSVVVPETLLICTTLSIIRCIAPFHIGVDAIVRQETSAIGVGLAKGDVDRHDFGFGEGICAEHRRGVE